MISYAQNGEDVILDRLFRDVSDGFFIDAGAAHPVMHSVTFHFYRRGWRGISIEPNPSTYEELCAVRPLDLNLNCGLSDREGSLTFYETPLTKSWSTDPEFLVGAFGADCGTIVSRECPVTTLTRICERHVDRPIDILKIDVEGQERQTIEGADWSRWRPRIVVVEGWPDVRWGRLLESDYLHALFDGINHYYVRAEDRGWLRLLKSAANATDDYVPYRYAEVEAMREKLLATQSALDASRATVELLRRQLLHV
jgi:FkbM family methyltransferase